MKFHDTLLECDCDNTGTAIFISDNAHLWGRECASYESKPPPESPLFPKWASQNRRGLELEQWCSEQVSAQAQQL